MALAAGGGTVLVTSVGTQQVAGAVHVFGRDGAQWSERQLLTSGGLPGEAFGAVLALAGELLLVGAPGADFGEGKVVAYRRERSGTWAESGILIDPPKALPAVTKAEVKCAEGEAAGFKCQDVDLLAFLPNAAIGAKRGIRLNDLWGWTDPETEREYALVGRMDGTSFVDVTDASNPIYLGDLPMHQGARANIWRDIKVYKNHAFIVADGAGPHGMQVFDLTQLRNVASPPVTFQETAHYDRIASAHNIAINEETGFAYPIGNSMGGETCGGALHMIDIRNPREPTFAGCYADPATGFQRTGYTHDAQCVTYKGPDTRFTGREICFNSSENALGIADVTDKKAPKPIASAAYPNVSYAHQGWLSDDQKYFYLDDEGDEVTGRAAMTRTLVWDLSKLDEPVLVKEFMGTTPASDHNLYVKGRYVFQSNYVAGLRVLDIVDPANPVEVGYFDTVGGDNVAGFDGSWSNYPYFKSGTIIVTSVREGLFIVKHRPRQPVP
jgi:choice-of-anchor B domain-containing protein